MDAFPDEIVLAILGHLPPASLARVACVSRRCNRLAMDDTLWRRHYEARCPPCGGPHPKQTCMAHKGRGLDHHPWLADWRAGEEAHFLARPYASHPLAPFIEARPTTRDSAFHAFARPPAHECPHHCPSVIKARSYRWALATQCAPPRPIDATGVRVGSGTWCPGRDLINCQGMVVLSGITGAYRGEWHARDGNPDGLGMLAMRQRSTTYGRVKDVRAVALWRTGDYAGLVRHWEECTVDNTLGHPNYREGHCCDGDSDGGGRTVLFSGAIAEGKTGVIAGISGPFFVA
ncbi:F-box domain containing protein [Pandoravirus japonicus]|uniref:F-box domain containing protein n=1 Tax=Pandoravirus japonicus TaxID=2823154 RepID=A0A811BRB0_9VIRU|nr:F-box domain containing protein [Pandoravirus japonicus]